MTEFVYVGSELDLFACAKNWKAYVSKCIVPYLGQRVLEVGAGFGGSTEVYCRPHSDLWLCVEPDADLAARLQARIAAAELPACCRLITGTIDDVPESDRFDSIMYLDVLEHIEDDQAEVNRAARYLNSGGYLIVLCPAHNYLFTPFDKSIGHFRRYNKSMMRDLLHDDLKLRRLSYLDSVGMFASLANRLLLNQSMPTEKQIRFWDGTMVPISRITDRFTMHCIGKSVLAIWQKS